MTTRQDISKLKFFGLIISIFFIFFLGMHFSVKPDILEHYLSGFPLLLASIVFIISYVIFTFFIWFSKDVFRFVSAVLFGVYISTTLVFIAEFINAVILFGISRYLGRDFVKKDIGKKFNWIEKSVEKINFFWLVLFRITPLIPFRFLDLSCGLTPISLKKYLLVVAVGSPLRIFWLQYILAGLGKNIFTHPEIMPNYLLANKPILIYSLIYFVLVIIVAFKMRKDN